MAQKKETQKKNVKVKDLAPKKDAKGGAHTLQGGTRNLDGGNRGLNAGGGRGLNAGGGRGLN